MECAINALVAESLEQRKRQIKSNNVQVNLNLATDLPQVTVDRIGIEQVIANLVKNAIDAMESQYNERSIWINSTFEAPFNGNVGCIELTVRDNGPGLQGRTIDTLSSTFYSTKATGMGLGLGICCAIIESHGGKVSARDAPDGGAEFSFTIPISNEIS
jgi:two-component system sensor histidine kinase DctS